MSLDSTIREMKNIEQLNCPQCTVLALFNFSTPKAVSTIEIREAQCQGCGGIIVQIRNVSYEVAPKSPFGGFKFEKEEALMALKAVLGLAIEWFIHRTKAEEFLQKVESKTQRTRKNHTA
jgi:hypothetical protein